MPPGLKEFFLRKRAARAEKPSGPTLNLSRPLAFALGLVLLSAIGWAYYIGLMVGRGENPEKHIQSVTGLIIKDEPAKKAPASEPAEEPGPEAAPQAVAEAGGAQNSAPQAAPYPFSRPREHQLDAWNEGKPAQDAAKPSQPRKPAPVRAARANSEQGKSGAPARGDVYNFTFQAAAYKNSREAENLKKKLTASGITARTAKNGKVWLVIATIRGNEASANTLRQKLQAMKLGKPLLISKKAVPSKPGKGAR